MIVNNSPQEIEKTIKVKCALSTCGKDLESINPRKRYCCDACRFKGYKERHAEKLKFLKFWQDQFKLNAVALKRLVELGIENPTKKDLRIAGFDFTVRDQERITTDGRRAFVFFDYIIFMEEPIQIYHQKP